MSTFIRAGRRTRDAVRSWIFIAGLAVWTAAVPAVAADGVGLYKDGRLIEELLPASALGAAPASSAVARDPQAFARLMAGELALEALGGELRPETVARNAALREAAQGLAALRETVRTMRAGTTAERTAGRAVLRAQATALAESFATTRRVFDEIGAQIAQARLPPEIVTRHRQSVADAARGHAALRDALDAHEAGDAGALARIDALLGELAGPTPDLARLGPTVRPETLRPAPALSRAEADAWPGNSARSSAVAAKEEPIELASAPPVAADLAATVEIQLTPEIVAQAAALGNSPLAIYEFVRNQIAFQPYLGSRKGAVETLHQRAGNDTDQASLLLALLRAAGIPSRYVRGTVEMTPARACRWLGVEDAATAGSILTTAGLDGLNIVNGTTVTAVRCTRVWVEAYVPYAQYRGAAGTTLGSAWVPLDPAFTGGVVTPGQDVLAAMAFNTDAFLTDYISTFHALSPVEKFVADIQTYLNGAQPGTTVAQIERRTAIAPQTLGLLPASVPNELRTVASRFSELEDAKRYKVRFRLYDGATTFVDHTINLSQLAGHRLTIDYVGATPADQATIDSFGGVYQTPPNLVNVMPRLKLDGAVLAASPNAIGLARTHNSDLHFLHPSGASNVQPLVQNTSTAGNSQAIAFDTFLDAGDGALFPSALPTPGFLETLLEDTAGEYLSRVDRGMEQVGRIMRVTTTQDVSEAIVESAVRVAYSFGVPVTFEWTGLIVDADRRIVGTFPVNGDNSQNVPFMKLTGYDGSTMENRVFEDLYGQRAVSTIKLLELSSDAGIPVFTIVTSIAADAPGLSQPASVVSAINTALSQGHRVIIPRTGITVGGWSGTGYIDLTPSTGAAGYIISGGISGNVVASGGATVDVWPINLGCAPIGAVTGTITPSGFADGEKLCPDAGQIAYSVQLAYDCKDSSGNVVHKTFGPTSHTVPRTKLQIVEIFGAGLYTISIPGTAVAPVTFTLVDVDSLKPDKGTEFDDGDGDPNTKLYAVAYSTTAGDLVTVTAKPSPDLPPAQLPACWSLTGGTGSSPITRTISQASASETEFVAQSGLRKKTTKVIVVKLVFTKFWETVNPANFVFNPTPKDDPPAIPADRLYAIESPADSRYHVTLDVDAQPASLRPKLMHAMYQGGSKLGTGEAVFPASGPADIVFDDPFFSAPGLSDFEVRVGHDFNGNGALDPEEILVPLKVMSGATALGPPQVRGGSESRYTAAQAGVAVEISANPLPHARQLLRIFRDGGTAGVPADKLPTTSGTVGFNCLSGPFSEWLTHNSGAPFAASGAATIPSYTWDRTTSLADLVGKCEQIAGVGKTFYAGSVDASVIAYFVGKPVGHVATFPLGGGFFAVPHVNESPGWPLTVTFDEPWIPNVTDDVNGTVGRGRLLGHFAQYTVEKRSLVGIEYLKVVQARYTGTVEDLYDFNVEAGTVAAQPAVLQIGHANGGYGASRAAAVIYRDRIEFDVALPDPF